MQIYMKNSFISSLKFNIETETEIEIKYFFPDHEHNQKIKMSAFSLNRIDDVQIPVRNKSTIIILLEEMIELNNLNTKEYFHFSNQ